MPVTHAQKIKAKKKKARERKIVKARNYARNLPDPIFRLDVDTGSGQWIIGAKQFRQESILVKYCNSVEEDRKAGKEILAARIVNIKDGKTIREIKGSKPKGTAPDKIADGPKASPNVVVESSEEIKDS